MTKNFNILFYIRRDKADSQNNVPIYCRITVDGKSGRAGDIDHLKPNQRDEAGRFKLTTSGRTKLTVLAGAN